MAYIPMHQTITVKRGSDTLDDWGNPVPSQTITYKCRIDESSIVTKSRSQRFVNDTTEMCKAKILLAGLVDIRYTDVISYTDELGKTTESAPTEINVRRNIGGKPIFTEVTI